MTYNAENNPEYSKLWSIRDFMRNIIRKKYNEIEVIIPIGFMNCGITTSNYFIADTNDSAKWDTLKFPLPTPKHKWNIKYYKADINKSYKKTVILIDKK